MLRQLFPGFGVRRAYFAADAQAGRALAVFGDPAGDVWSRVHALKAVSGCERAMADAAHIVGGTERDEDGFTLAESHRSTATLLDLVAGTEEIAYGLVTFGPAVLRADLFGGFPATEVVDRLCTEPRRKQRAELMAELYDAVVRRVGGQAAEVLVAVARGYWLASGMSLPEANWRTTCWGRVPSTQGGGR